MPVENQVGSGMNHTLTQDQQQKINAEKSRRLHDLLASYDTDLRALEAEPTRYTVAEYNLRFQAIQRNREQVRKEIGQIF